MSHKTFPCKNCGADLEFKAGSNALTCPFCGAANEIKVDSEKKVEEQDYHSFLQKLENEANVVDQVAVDCEYCGAQTAFDENVVASACPFCGSKIVAQNKSIKTIKPESILPFKVTKDQARNLFQKWLSKRWFMPNSVKKFAQTDGLNGIYSPYWTYDAATSTSYSGERGEYYYETEYYTEMEGDEEVTKEREVRKTRWYSASGVVSNSFDDLTVVGSTNIPRKLADKLTPWDLENLVPYQDDYLSGYRVESYTIDLKEGFEDAKEKMEPDIESSIRRDIGGDEQRISHKNSNYFNISFKHLLLPIWISSYRHGSKVYQYLVNARTGEVQGERPYSAAKIALAVLLGIGVAAGIYIAFKVFGGS